MLRSATQTVNDTFHQHRTQKADRHTFAIRPPRYCASSFTDCSAMGAESLISLMTSCGVD